MLSLSVRLGYIQECTSSVRHLLTVKNRVATKSRAKMQLSTIYFISCPRRLNRIDVFLQFILPHSLGTSLIHNDFNVASLEIFDYFVPHIQITLVLTLGSNP